MDTKEFKRLLDERDKELGVSNDDFYYGGAIPAIHQLFEQKPVKLFDGSLVTFAEQIDYYSADYDGSRADLNDGWHSSNYATGRTIVVQCSNGTDATYFRLTGYDDSWDNGKPDIWVLSEPIVEVTKVPVDKYKWEEVN